MKRVRRAPTIEGMDVDEFIRRNADPIWLHQNELWEYMMDEPSDGEEAGSRDELRANDELAVGDDLLEEQFSLEGELLYDDELLDERFLLEEDGPYWTGSNMLLSQYRRRESASMSTQPEHLYTDEEYLAIERASDTKNEYLDGVIYAMGGASPRHVQIVGNVSGELRNRLRNTPCVVYSTDLRVRVSRGGLYAYPDVVVVCGEPVFIDDQLDTLTNPVLIVEVLSSSTKNYDRGEKFERYRTNPTLQEYVLIAQDMVHVEAYTRENGGVWVLRETNNPDDTVELTSVGCHLPVAEIYFKVSFVQSTPSQQGG
jgi:Uma2 family endonuclease